MSTDVYLLMAYMGIFYVLMLLSNILFIALGYSAYKKGNGKMNFWQYFKRRWLM